MIYYLILVLLGVLLIYLHLTVHHSKKGKLVNRLPGPTTASFLGNAYQLAVTPGDMYKLFRKWGKVYYPAYRIWNLNLPLINIRHPDDLEILFKSKEHITKKFGYEHLQMWLKTGLLSSSGEKWHQRRKILTPAFHFNALKEHMATVNKFGQKMINKMRNEGAETKVEVESFCMEFTLNVICESSMGVAVDDETDKEATTKYKEALKDMVYLIIYRNIRPYLTDWALPLVPKIHERIKNSVNVIHNFTSKVIQQRREYHEDTKYKDFTQLKQNNDEDNNRYDKKKVKLAMLDLLLFAEKNNLIDNEGIQEEVSTFIFEGHDTTGISLLFTILLLAENEDVQTRARKEVEDIFNRAGGKLDTLDLKDMVYLERVIKESLRLHPSVPSFVRHMTSDLQLKNCLAPQGCDVIMHVVDVHRDPNFWPNPEEFDPDRFLPEEINKRHPFAYVPFSAGSRNCIGQKFAMMEMKIFIALVLYNFYLEPIDRTCDIDLIADVIMRPSQPVHTKFIRIDRN